MRIRPLLIALVFTLNCCDRKEQTFSLEDKPERGTSEYYHRNFIEGRDISPYIAIFVMEDYEVTTGELQGGIRYEVFHKATITKSLKGNFRKGDQIHFHHAYETDTGSIPKHIPGNKAIVFIHDEYDTDRLFYLDTGDYLRHSQPMEEGLIKAMKTLNL